MARLLFVVPNVPWPLATGGHLRDWQLLNLLARRGLAPAMLYFGAGEEALLAPHTPVAALASSVAFGGTRVENPDGGPLGTVARKLAYLAGTAATHPFAYQYDAIDAATTIVGEARRVGADVVLVRGFWCHAFPLLRASGLRVIANCRTRTRASRARWCEASAPRRASGPRATWSTSGVSSAATSARRTRSGCRRRPSATRSPRSRTARARSSCRT
jgi:hypothetical protein